MDRNFDDIMDDFADILEELIDYKLKDYYDNQSISSKKDETEPGGQGRVRDPHDKRLRENRSESNYDETRGGPVPARRSRRARRQKEVNE